MTNSNDDDRRGRTRGDRPFRSRDRDRDNGPYKPRGDRAKPFRAREGDERRPRRDDDRPYPKPRDEGDRPRRPRPEGERPYRPRTDAERPSFRARSGDEGDRPRRPRSEGERPYRPRTDAERPSFRNRGGDERPRRFDRSAEERPRRPREMAAEVTTEAPKEEPAEERIAKVIARAGIASRRDAEAMIEQGRVSLNGEVLTSPAQNVGPDDRITIDGEPLPAKERTRLWLFHKPRGLVTTARDPEGRPTVFDGLPEDMPRVVAIGRLDINTEGLLLLTNDGGLAKVIAHPDTGWLRRYKVRAHGDITQADLDKLRDGVTVDEMEYGPVEARLDRVQGDNVWLTLGLREGKNREVKRILEYLGLQVNRLIRLSFGPFQLGDIEPGLVEEVKTRVLKDQLGATLAAEAGVDFESPVREPIAPFGSPKKQERARETRDERPGRFDRDRDEYRDDRRRYDRHDRHEDYRPRFRRDEEEAPKRPSRNEPKRSFWRAGEEEGEPRRSKAPRRGADPREARAATAARPHERVGSIRSGEGRKVTVERLVSQPHEEERPTRRPRRDDAERPARREGFARPRRDDDRPPRRETGERPFRSRDGDRPARSDERPRRGPPRGDAPPRGGSFKDGPRNGFRGGPRGGSGGGFKGGGFKGGGFKGGGKGGFKSGGKGGPRGRRP